MRERKRGVGKLAGRYRQAGRYKQADTSRQTDKDELKEKDILWCNCEFSFREKGRKRKRQTDKQERERESNRKGEKGRVGEGMIRSKIAVLPASSSPPCVWTNGTRAQLCTARVEFISGVHRLGTRDSFKFLMNVRL